MADNFVNFVNFVNFAIIPAAGCGVRLGGDTKKQFLPLNGRSMLDHVLTRFIDTHFFSKIVVCLPKDELEKYRDAPSPQPPPSRGGGKGEGGEKKVSIIWVEGGNTRGESVRNGFKALSAKSSDIVLIHDVARPLVSLDLIDRVVAATQKFGAVIPGMPVSDTVKEVVEGKITKTLDRKKLIVAQTPQGFSAKFLEKAYETLDLSKKEFTDEAMLVEETGQTVHVIEGERTNFKITTEFDLKMAERFL